MYKNTIIEKGCLIKKIIANENIQEIYDLTLSNIFKNGPVNRTDLEILSYLKELQPDFFKEKENNLVQIMGLFFKKANIESLEGLILKMYGESVKEDTGFDYTPMQADIVRKIENKLYFSFSAPTSTGKSFVFRNLVKLSKKDIAIIVPSRALINEYYDKLIDLIKDKDVNILTFVDQINKKHSSRNIFILTPERARELFNNKDWINLEFVLLDEAQLSEDKGVRGLYFDSIVRRLKKHFPSTKIIFAHPFISNPEAQLKKHSMDYIENTSYKLYEQKNVGQIFYQHKTSTNEFKYFGVNKEILGLYSVKCENDPIETVLKNGGTVLIYVPKTHIKDKSIYIDFNKYINMCKKIKNKEAKELIEELKIFLGGAIRKKSNYHSTLIRNLERGIVIHHGSIPLVARQILEKFTQKGFCKICFATSTLEQGINMPFDLVYIDRFRESDSLGMKNLIGRAGRSTEKPVFDIGRIVVKDSTMSRLRNVLLKKDCLIEESKLDTEDDSLDEKYQEFKDAINNDTFNDEYNLTSKDLEKVKKNDLNEDIEYIINNLFTEKGTLTNNISDKTQLVESFINIYEYYLGRDLTSNEKIILNTALKIMLWKLQGKTFKKICHFRYTYASKINERKKLKKQGFPIQADLMQCNTITGFSEIPNKNINSYSLFPKNTLAKDIDYDTIIYDTYDFLDKLIGFKLSDIYFAFFKEYGISHKSEKAIIASNYIKYGTNNKKEIWLLRYGFEFEDINWLLPYVVYINEDEIKFKDEIKQIDSNKFKKIEKYLY